MKPIVWSLIVDSFLTIVSIVLNFNIEHGLRLFRPTYDIIQQSNFFSLTIEYLASIIPVIGEMRDIYEICTGNDFLSGEKLRAFDIVFDCLSVTFNYYLFFHKKITYALKERKLSLIYFSGDA